MDWKGLLVWNGVAVAPNEKAAVAEGVFPPRGVKGLAFVSAPIVIIFLLLKALLS